MGAQASSFIQSFSVRVASGMYRDGTATPGKGKQGCAGEDKQKSKKAYMCHIATTRQETQEKTTGRGSEDCTGRRSLKVGKGVENKKESEERMEWLIVID